MLYLLLQFFLEIVARPLFAIFSVIACTPFILIRAAFDRGRYSPNVATRYRDAWDWWFEDRSFD
jgi:hypothetical protein